MGHPESRALVQLLLDGLDDGRVAMPRHQGSETQVVINVFVAVDVVNPAALPVVHKNRIRLVVAIIAGYTERDSFESTLVSTADFLVRFS